MMKRFWRLASAVLLLLSAVSVQAGSVSDMNPGLWEITTQMKMPGMEMPANTMTECITKDSAVPPAGYKQGQCEFSDVEVRGNTVNWSIRCDSQGGVMTGSGETTYHGDTFEGSTRMSMQGMEITTKMSGRRIGECP